MKPSFLAPLAMVIGLFLLALSFAWPVMGASTSAWTEAQAVRKQELNKRLHGLAHVGNEGAGHGHGDMEEGIQLDQAKEKGAAIRERAELQEELDSVLDGSRRMVALFKWSGVGLVALGTIVFLVRKQQANA